MLIDLATAKLHLRVDGTAEDALIPVYISAAELSAVAYLQRNVYADAPALADAVAAAPDALSAATATYTAEIEAADAVEDDSEKAEATNAAEGKYLAARVAYRSEMAGVVVNDVIRAAILLTLGHLYANREDVVTGVSVAQLPSGVQYLLQPYRAGMGV